MRNQLHVLMMDHGIFEENQLPERLNSSDGWLLSLLKKEELVDVTKGKTLLYSHPRTREHQLIDYSGFSQLPTCCLSAVCYQLRSGLQRVG